MRRVAALVAGSLLPVLSWQAEACLPSGTLASTPGTWAACPPTTAAVPQAHQVTGFPKVVPAGRSSTLPESSRGVRMAVFRTYLNDCNHSVLIARSYDGYAWEAAPSALQLNLIQPSCSGVCGTGCTLTIPVGSIYEYRVEAIDLVKLNEVGLAPMPAANTSVARFLMQATFGPTRTDINNFLAAYPLSTNAAQGTDIGPYAAWIRTQMDLPPTLLRAYFRQRSNPRSQVATTTGRPLDPCEANSRWHRYSFTTRDVGLIIEEIREPVVQRFSLRVDGVLRTQISKDLLLGTPWNAGVTTPSFYRICRVSERVGGWLYVVSPSSTCSHAVPVNGGNPSIYFTSGVQAADPRTSAQTFDVGQIELRPLHNWSSDAQLLVSTTVPCMITASNGSGGNIFIQVRDATGIATAYKYDPRLDYVANTLEAPANSSTSIHALGSGTNFASGSCPTVRRSFLNAATCKRHKVESGQLACMPLKFDSAPFQLNASTVRVWHLDQKYVYVLRGLRLESPYAISVCRAGRKPYRSRWVRTLGICANPTQFQNEADGALIAAAIDSVTGSAFDTNPNVRDIVVSDFGNCSESDPGSIGSRVQVGVDCWENVHPDEKSVYDSTLWARIHPGNLDAARNSRPNPIRRFADLNEFTLNFPSWHSMSRWQDSKNRFTYVGREGDIVDFEDLPSDLQTTNLANLVGANGTGSSQLALEERVVGVEVCGSPGEVTNEPQMGNRYVTATDSTTLRSGTYYTEIEWAYHKDHGKSYVAQNVALTADDQLRQRVANALSQILVVAEEGISGRNDRIEPWVQYYDIFVRHAFGNYWDILREVSRSLMMSTYLTFLRNKAYRVHEKYPDENYAREIMQLFSIGLWKLNMNGTKKLDSNMMPIESYSNNDVMSFSRIFTGYDNELPRANIESGTGAGGTNEVDPTQIKPQWRDTNPKTNLIGGYVGDNYPLCEDLPPQAFLSSGARYVYTGTESAEGHSYDNDALINSTARSRNRGRFQPSAASSSLYALLCSRSESTGNCTFPSEVVLTANIPCDGIQECDAETITVVEMVDYSTSPPLRVFYTYERPPCVSLAIFDDGKIVAAQPPLLQCASSQSMVAASPVCCTAGTDYASSNFLPIGDSAQFDSKCRFSAETMTYRTASTRCHTEFSGSEICQTLNTSNFDGKYKMTRFGCSYGMYHWTSTPCSLKLQIHLSGEVNIVQEITQSSQSTVAINSGNTFGVQWDNGTFPKISGSCSNVSGCVVINSRGGSCLCDVAVVENAVYTSASVVPTYAKLVRERLSIGAHNPAMYPAGTYDVLVLSSEVTLHLKGGDFGKDTIVELSDTISGSARQYPRFMRNLESRVHIGSESGVHFSLRNPPQFMQRTGEALSFKNPRPATLNIPRAENEEIALLEHLLHHRNTAPFLAYRLIQRLVTSNPSPRYISAVATAFSSGAYLSFGDGKHGNMAATIAAILLDREARSVILDTDPTFGQLREPMMKVLQFMRSMQYTPKNGREVGLFNMKKNIGQNIFQQPTVFNFFLAEFAPPGHLENAALVAPEAQLLTAPNVVGFLNSMMQLVNDGLSDCYGGLGDYVTRTKDSTLSDSCGAWITNSGRSAASRIMRRQNSFGALDFAPSDPTSASAVVDELSLYLTAGKLSSASRAIVENAFQATLNVEPCCANFTAPDEALRSAMKHLLLTPEFHTTASVSRTESARRVPSLQQSSGKPFKATVVLFLSGGADTFDMLVPHSQCRNASGPHDLYREYEHMRGAGVAQSLHNLLPIDVTTSPTPQPCDTMGLHQSMVNLKAMYDSGEAAIFANMGALVEPITKPQYETKTRRIPPSLFAHNVMQKSAATLHAQYAPAAGVLARVADALINRADPYKTMLFSTSGNERMVSGADSVTPTIIPGGGNVEQFREWPDMQDATRIMMANSMESLLADHAAKTIASGLEATHELGRKLESVDISGPAWPSLLDTMNDHKKASKQLHSVAKLIKLAVMRNSSGLDLERAAFISNIGGWDTHSDASAVTKNKLEAVDLAIRDFRTEMLAQGLWDNVTLVVVSEFGRTLTSNGHGTDHAWGGNYFAVGGSVRGGKIFGKYPTHLEEELSDVNIGRGRILPTTSWEALYHGLVAWMGVPTSSMTSVLPNIANFPSSAIFQQWDLFSTASEPASTPTPAPVAEPTSPTVSPPATDGSTSATSTTRTHTTLVPTAQPSTTQQQPTPPYPTLQPSVADRDVSSSDSSASTVDMSAASPAVYGSVAATILLLIVVFAFLVRRKRHKRVRKRPSYVADPAYNGSSLNSVISTAPTNEFDNLGTVNCSHLHAQADHGWEIARVQGSVYPTESTIVDIQ